MCRSSRLALALICASILSSAAFGAEREDVRFSAQTIEAITSAESIEAYVLAGRGLESIPPGYTYEELHWISVIDGAGYRVQEQMPSLPESTSLEIVRLMLDESSYMPLGYKDKCFDAARYAFRIMANPQPIYAFLSGNCSWLSFRSESGARLGGGHIGPSEGKWRAVRDIVFESRNEGR